MQRAKRGAVAGSAGAPPPRVTISMIAGEAGVSVSTVSRVLSRVDPVTGEGPSTPKALRIREIARRVGYVPDPYAASLRTKVTKAIGVLVPRLTDIVLATIYEGIEETADRHGYQTFVANTHDDADQERRRIDLLLSRRVDGLIIGDAHVDGGIGDELRRREVPFVLVNRHASTHLSVTCDDDLGGQLAGEHLAELGHRRIAIVAGEAYASTGRDRTQGCLRALSRRGIKVPPDRIVYGSFDTMGGRIAAEQLLSARRPPSAIFAVNDFAAIGVMGAIRDRGLSVGEDIAVVGFNDISLAAQLPVPLTTVHSEMRTMGARGMELLLELLGGGRPESELIPPRLVVRASTVPGAGAGDGQQAG